MAKFICVSRKLFLSHISAPINGPSQAVEEDDAGSDALFSESESLDGRAADADCDGSDHVLDADNKEGQEAVPNSDIRRSVGAALGFSGIQGYTLHVHVTGCQSLR